MKASIWKNENENSTTTVISFVKKIAWIIFKSIDNGKIGYCHLAMDVLEIHFVLVIVQHFALELYV